MSKYMEKAFENYKLPVKKKLAAFEFQDRCANVLKELEIPKEISLGEKKINLHSIAFQLFKRNRPLAETFYQVAKDKKTPGKYFCWLMLNKKNL